MLIFLRRMIPILQPRVQILHLESHVSAEYLDKKANDATRFFLGETMMPDLGCSQNFAALMLSF